MYEYLKKLFENAIIQGQKLVGRSLQSLNSELTENDGNVLDYEEPLGSSSEPKVKIFIGNTEPRTRNYSEEIKQIRRQMRFCAKQLRKVEREKTPEPIVENKREGNKGNCRLSEDTCRCDNCSIVSSFNECGICLESLQNRRIRSCLVCANLVCSQCARKLTSCPFCRSSKPLQKNRAIERLLGGLFMPCKNSRNGCGKMLNAETRSEHEANCEYASISCPIASTCRWNGPSVSLLAHLQKVHDVIPLKDNGVTIKISDIHGKATTKAGEYTIYLACHGQLYAVRIKLHRKKLSISLVQMGFVTKTREKLGEKKYGAWLKLKVAGQSVRAVLSFGKYDHETREIVIDCETLFSGKNGTPSSGDNVNIEISLREMTASCERKS